MPAGASGSPAASVSKRYVPRVISSAVPSGATSQTRACSVAPGPASAYGAVTAAGADVGARLRQRSRQRGVARRLLPRRAGGLRAAVGRAARRDEAAGDRVGGRAVRVVGAAGLVERRAARVGDAQLARGEARRAGGRHVLCARRRPRVPHSVGCEETVVCWSWAPDRFESRNCHACALSRCQYAGLFCARLWPTSATATSTGQLRVDRLQPVEHPERLDRLEQVVGPARDGEHRAVRRHALPVLVEGRAVLRQAATGLRDDGVFGRVRVADADDPRVPRGHADRALRRRRGARALLERAVGVAAREQAGDVAGLRGADRAARRRACRGRSAPGEAEVGPRVLRHRDLEAQRRGSRSPPSGVGGLRPALAATVGAAADGDPVAVDVGEHLRDLRRQVLRVADLDLVALDLDRAARRRLRAAARRRRLALAGVRRCGSRARCT